MNRVRQDSNRRRLLSERAQSRRSTYRQDSTRSRLSSLPFLSDIDIYINGGFEPEDEEEIEAQIEAIDQVFVPTVHGRILVIFKDFKDLTHLLRSSTIIEYVFNSFLFIS